MEEYMMKLTEEEFEQIKKSLIQQSGIDNDDNDVNEFAKTIEERIIANVIRGLKKYDEIKGD